MNGWRYEWVESLDQDVHEVLVEEMNRLSTDTDDA